MCRNASARLLPPEIFDALANVEISGVDKAVYFRHSILQALYTSQHGVVNEKECKAVGVANVRKMPGLAQKVLLADRTLSMVWQLGKDA
eukprot:5125700-Karenia_brevis.AAC.1